MESVCRVHSDNQAGVDARLLLVSPARDRWGVGDGTGEFLELAHDEDGVSGAA